MSEGRFGISDPMVSMTLHVISNIVRNSFPYLMAMFDSPIAPPKRAMLKCNAAQTSDSAKNVGQESASQ